MNYYTKLLSLYHTGIKLAELQRRFFSFLLLFGFYCMGYGQNSSSTSGKAEIYRAKLSPASIIKDSSGKIFPEDVWKKLLMTGYYSIKPENPGKENSDYIIIRLTEEERVKRISSARPKQSKSDFKAGEKPENFSAKDINGVKYKLNDLAGKVVVLNFWFINCSPCRAEILELNKLVKEYHDSANVVFLAIALDDKADIKEFMAKEPFNYNIIAGGKSVADQYRISAYPTHAVIDKEGKVCFHTQGSSAGTIYWLRKSIDEAITPPFAK